MSKMINMPSTTGGQHKFSMVPAADIPRSQFVRSHGFKTTFDAGWLVPIFVDDILPGDTFNHKTHAFARLATPINPFMDNMFLEVFYFFVPNRLVWTNWEKMNGQQENPGDSTSYITPTSTSPAGGYLNQTLQDYMGLPTQVEGITHNSLPLRAYNLIYNQWFRDQNLQNSLPVPKGDGPDAPGDFVLKRRGKRHDYFTSALPWPQKGPAVTLPLGGTATVVRNPASTNAAITRVASSGALSGAVAAGSFGVDASSRVSGAGVPFSIDPNGTMLADLTTATAATINQLRQAFQIQKIYERDARGGTRYTEILQAHFGVVSDDARLQRPEFLGSSQTSINVNPIAQTSAQTGQPTPQGNLAAIGTAALHNVGYTKSFTEHGFIIGIATVRADLNYQQGLDRMWSRSTRFDYYWPALSHIGEQAILNKEIYAVGSANPTQDNAVFGYQERFAEYRYKPSKITGQFRSNYTQTLDSWHLAQNFTSLPLLNGTFIEENPPVDRVIAVPSEPHFIMDVWHELKSARPMPTYSVPGLIDHF